MQWQTAASQKGDNTKLSKLLCHSLIKHYFKQKIADIQIKSCRHAEQK